MIESMVMVEINSEYAVDYAVVGILVSMKLNKFWVNR